MAIKQSARQILRIPPLERLRLGIVEGSIAWHEGGVDVVGTGNSVGSEEGDDLEWRESSGVIETLKNVGDAVLGLGDQTVDSRSGGIGATSEELETGCTLSSARAV